MYVERLHSLKSFPGTSSVSHCRICFFFKRSWVCYGVFQMWLTPLCLGCMEDILHRPFWTVYCTTACRWAGPWRQRAASCPFSSTKIHLSRKISLNCPTNHCYHWVSYKNLRYIIKSHFWGTYLHVKTSRFTVLILGPNFQESGLYL